MAAKIASPSASPGIALCHYQPASPAIVFALAWCIAAERASLAACIGALGCDLPIN